MYHVMHCTLTLRLCCHQGAIITARVISVQHLSLLLPCTLFLDGCNFFCFVKNHSILLLLLKPRWLCCAFQSFFLLVCPTAAENLHFESKKKRNYDHKPAVPTSVHTGFYCKQAWISGFYLSISSCERISPFSIYQPTLYVS